MLLVQRILRCALPLLSERPTARQTSVYAYLLGYICMRVVNKVATYGINQNSNAARQCCQIASPVAVALVLCMLNEAEDNSADNPLERHSVGVPVAAVHSG